MTRPTCPPGRDPGCPEAPLSLARIGALVGDPVRAAILLRLTDGSRRPASELARLAGASPQAASAHLARLVAGGLLRVEAQGRHRFFSLASGEAAETIEGLTAFMPLPRPRPERRDADLRRARVCYDHVAGRLGVVLFDRMVERGWLVLKPGGATLGAPGAGWCAAQGLDPSAGPPSRRPLLRLCHDWTERRPHAGGRLGASLAALFLARGHLRRRPGERSLDLTAEGRRFFEREFGIRPLDLAPEDGRAERP